MKKARNYCISGYHLARAKLAVWLMKLARKVNSPLKLGVKDGD